MSTQAQIKANRQNSQKSTGPKSAEGKAAVAKNAVRHGLFANEAVIKGENAEEFEAFRDEMLTELAPVGSVESMLAERFVSLSWRLKRVERMQNQAIDVMIERDENPGPLAKLTKSFLPKDFRQSSADASASNGELALGRAAIKDYSNSRVLDRLMMYERRIEHSMFKTKNELERLRMLRELEQAEDGGQMTDDGGQLVRRNLGEDGMAEDGNSMISPQIYSEGRDSSPGVADNEPEPCLSTDEVDLKKQSQFGSAQEHKSISAQDRSQTDDGNSMVSPQIYSGGQLQTGFGKRNDYESKQACGFNKSKNR